MTQNKIQLLLFLLLLSTDLNAQYKSRMFDNTGQQLSDSEQQNIVALQQAFASYEDAYQIATTGQYLARQMLAAQEYEKAAEYYKNVLQTQAFQALAVKQLMQEYAQVLLVLQRYDEVVALFKSRSLDSSERLLLARASIGQQEFHKAVEWLAPLTDRLSELNMSSLEQIAGLYYQAKAFPLAAEAMAELVTRNPSNLKLARQLTGMYIQLSRYADALDLWSLTYSRLGFKQESDLVLLADLYNRQGSPDKAARLLSSGIEKGFIADTPELYYKLFTFWYHSKEQSAAREALWQSVKRSNNFDHALLLAELLQQSQEWGSMQQLIDAICHVVLPNKYVGRVNLMLGIANHKLGNNESARRAFINASLVSGVNKEAREWLGYIQATPATLEESRELWGDCIPEDPTIKLPEEINETATQAQSTQEVSNNTEKLKVVTLKAARFYGTKISTTAATMQQDVPATVFNIIKNLLRAGGKVDGKMHFLFSEKQTSEKLSMTIAFQYTGLPLARGIYKVIKQPEVRAVTTVYNGPAEGLALEWSRLTTAAIEQGLTPTEQARMVFIDDESNSSNVHAELQLIVE